MMPCVQCCLFVPLDGTQFFYQLRCHGQITKARADATSGFGRNMPAHHSACVSASVCLCTPYSVNIHEHRLNLIGFDQPAKTPTSRVNPRLPRSLSRGGDEDQIPPA